MSDAQPRPFQKLLVANRSEIAIRVFRSAHELGIRTVAIYSHEDRFALHRFKADEAYRVGKAGEPIRAYLDIPGIVQLAKDLGVDAIHPGYGFLSENAGFARECAAAGIAFVGPRVEVLEQLGDKVSARALAKKANVPVLSGGDRPLKTPEEAKELAEKLGYPVIVKASMGGGGRGMRVVHTADKLAEAVEAAGREAGAAFGVSDVFLEKFVQRAKHIEVQLIGDKHGGLVHLFERDCSVQRRHQKVVELAPAPNLPADVRQGILDAALAVGHACGIDNASTVEFLYDTDAKKFYFIEVNPRIQVEHTVTEQVTGFDIVRSQLLIASGLPLADPRIGLQQSAITTRGFAIQCRVTTEDPANGFVPDYGRLSAYRSSGGPGIRLDSGNAFGGAVITPFYDSLLVKVTVSGLSFESCATRMERCLQEFRIRGVKTNLPFLLNLIQHPQFLAGDVTTRFLDETPDLFRFTARRDRASKLLSYLGEIIVNGHPEIKDTAKWVKADPAGGVITPSPLHRPTPAASLPKGTRDRFKELGAEKFAAWTREESRLLITDTTMRDAHQSLFATRMRTFDMLAVADRYAREHADLFSLEMWGGATFDTAMRFLKESPWDRLAKLRERIPNILFQMLVRAASAVGYTNYPDNVVYEFVRLSAEAGMDIFRIFDANNWLPNIKLGIDAVRKTDAICEAAVCYTGDILDPKRDKYTLNYFVNLAKELEKLGTHILAIKDMAGLLKPYAAKRLVKALREAVGVPIHFHTHDSAGGQIASYMMAATGGRERGRLRLRANGRRHVAAEFERAGGSGPLHPPRHRLELRRAARDGELLGPMSASCTRRLKPGKLASSAEVYLHEMPGGQYANLYQQAHSLGVGDRWPEVGKLYAAVNQMFGDIVKVTPTSKVVGDMTLFMLANNLTPDMVLDPKREIAFPESVVEFFEGQARPAAGRLPAGVAGADSARSHAAHRAPRRDTAAGRLRESGQGVGREAPPPADRTRSRVVLALPESVPRIRQRPREVFRLERAAHGGVLLRSDDRR